MVILVLQNFLENGFLENRFETLMIFFFQFFFKYYTPRAKFKKNFFEKFCMNMGEIDYGTFCPNLPYFVG